MDMAVRKHDFREDHAEVDIPIWKEALFGVDILLLHASPVYYGLGIPHGDGSAVVVIPGFLGTDRYLTQLHSWLGRIGYKSYLSGIGINAECPNLLIEYLLRETIDHALEETGKKIHLIGHSLGGIIARSVAAQRCSEIASVITLASPFRGTVLHHAVLGAAEAVRKNILKEHGHDVLPTCYTGRCTCEFVNHLRCLLPACVDETAIYTRNDGIVDWEYCMTGKPNVDFEVPGTHMGLVFNSTAYNIIAHRLADPHSRPTSTMGR
jgi:PGAP1-like protein